MKNYPSCDVWQTLASSPDPLYLYGTGNGADKILDIMASRKINPAGIFVSDDFYRGQVFRGFSVQPLSSLAAMSTPPLLVISFGSHLPYLIRRIQDLSRTFRALIPDVPVAGDTLFDLSFCESHTQDLENARDLLADEASRKVFDQIVHYKLTGDPASLFASVSLKEEILSLLASHHPDAVPCYVDCGAYRGDTIEEFFRFFPFPNYSITALEPEPGSFRKLQQAFGDDPRIRLIQAACGKESGELILYQGRGRGTHVPSDQKTAAKTIKVPLVRLDDLSFPSPPTYLKMDIEGKEKEALLGASRLIQTAHPLMNIACYHRSEDLYELPMLLHELYPGYRIYLRRHESFPCWDLNLYLIPESM